MKKIFAEVLTIGDEILYGQITNTNTQFISTELDKIGIKVIRHTSIGDDEAEILAALAEAEARADAVLMTGGLGPTKDDITKKTLAKYFNTHLEIDEKVLEMVKAHFQRRGREMVESNIQQAAIPANAQPLYNRLGTAPGIWFETNGKVFVSMPGVPFEMQGLMEEHVIPRLRKHFQTPIIMHRIIKTYGAGESKLAEIINDWEDNLPENIKLAYLPTYGEVKLRLTGFGEDSNILAGQIQAEIDKVVPMIAKYVFGYDKDELELVVGNLLVEQGKTIATAESCTGGFLAHLFTKIPGSSRYFQGGIVSYSNDIKISQLGVKEETLIAHGAVSEATVREMAENVRLKYNTSIGLATSGVAGPDGGSEEKPVGTVWIAYSDAHETYAKKLQLTTERMLNIRHAATIVMDLLRRKLQGWMD
ncbi:MAG: competence/damage-inducible protein A [Microscillaceae bacterium]|nr:competence/damage-inducible protein A [Microscillaceae bacterium]